jgi:hypothetical protein
VKVEKRKPRPGPSVYEGYFLPTDNDDWDKAEWHLLAEQDPVTGRWTHYRDYKPFRQTPLFQWKPRQR